MNDILFCVHCVNGHKDVTGAGDNEEFLVVAKEQRWVGTDKG
jgi:hypothetical protein